VFEPHGREYIAVLTEKAHAFGEGVPSRIVAAGFAKFLHQHGIEFGWHDDLTFSIDTRWPLLPVVHSTTDDHNTFAVPPHAHAVIARIERDVMVLQGVWGAVTDVSRFEPEAVPNHQLLSMGEWLGAFPHLWPQPEEDTHERNGLHGLRADHDPAVGRGHHHAAAA
jgi:hypothetical protein